MVKLFQSLVAMLLIIVSTTLVRAEDPKTFYNIPDDGYAIVPIPFGFPFYGRLFTHSIMFDNGVVSFYDPTTESARLGGQQFNAFPLSNNIGSNFHYSIMPLWSDLVGNSNSKFYTQTDSSTYLKYSWQDVQQWGYADRLNSFSLEIKPTGFFGVTYDKVNIGGYPVTVGHVGDASAGEWSQIYHQPSGGETTPSNLQSWSVGSTGAVLDCSSPLNDPACPGYADAYYNQQCSISALYDPACPGYDTAYLEQQCNTNSLYSALCPGYAVAYLEQQCSIDPLYSTTCDGYDTAYFNQQCGLNPLYNNQCLGYDDAYYVQQCTLDPLYDSGCTGYETAFYDQQCSLSSLYDSGCPGYQQAFYDQQCSLSSLYDSGCPGYETAFYNQQCSLNALYDRMCPNYATEYTKQNLIKPVETMTISTVPSIEATTNLATPSTPSSIEVAAVVQLTPQPTSTQELTNVISPSSLSSSTTTSASTNTETKREVSPTRQALAERRLAAARAKAIEDGKKSAEEMGNATSLEQQMEVQNVVLSVMGFVPGFDAYSQAVVPDGIGYKPFTIYDNQRNIDTPAARRLLSGSDRLHKEMIDAQYR
jgi:hypothetical protein